MRRAALLGMLLVLGSACTAAKQTIASPAPSLEPISDFFARLSPRPSVSPSPSPSPSAAAQSAGRSATARPGGGAAPRTSSTAASGRVFCPSGSVGAEVVDLSASDTGAAPSSNGDHRYDVSVSGTATNGASASVRAVHLSVTVHAHNSHASSYDVTVAQTIAPGATVGWSGRFTYRAAQRPSGDSGSVAVVGWSWANSSLSSCPV